VSFLAVLEALEALGGLVDRGLKRIRGLDVGVATAVVVVLIVPAKEFRELRVLDVEFLARRL
jgi:hypothetical protein